MAHTRTKLRRPALMCLAGACALALGLGPVQMAFVQAPKVADESGRRALLQTAALAGLMGLPEVASASGGSTAGKYSTIPSAKRRFYGRVRQGIYQFLLLEKPISEGDLSNPVIQDFFAKNVVKNKGGGKKPGCNWDEETCTVKERRTSRWNDFKAAADLLASAFRYDAGDVNDYLPQVKLIRGYAKKIEKMKTAIDNGDAAQAQTLFASCKVDLSRYLPMVELEPIDSTDYTHEWDTRPQVWCQGNFCV